MHSSEDRSTPFAAKFTSARYCSEKMTLHIATGIAACKIKTEAIREPVPINIFTKSSAINGEIISFRKQTRYTDLLANNSFSFISAR